MIHWRHEQNGWGFEFLLPPEILDAPLPEPRSEWVSGCGINVWSPNCLIKASGMLLRKEPTRFLAMLENGSLHARSDESFAVMEGWLEVDLLARPSGPVCLKFVATADKSSRAEIEVPADRGTLERLVREWRSTLKRPG